MLTLVALIFPFLLAGAGAIIAGQKGAWVVFAIELGVLAVPGLLLSPTSSSSINYPDLFWVLVAVAYLAACSYLAGRFVSGPTPRAES